MESDSSDDEDFVLTSAMEKEAYSEEKTSTKTKKEGMFGDLIEQKRKAKVDSLWQEMNSVGAPTSVPGKKKGGKKAAKKSQKNVKRAKEMMGDIFGKKTGANLVSKTSFTTKSTAGAQMMTTMDIAKLVRPLTKTVEVKKKFAGKVITVKKKVANDGSADQKKETGGLDNLLSTLTGPTKVSTIAKTSSDWDTFKDVTGVNEELELNNQNGYLTKKDFLNRCDVRQFEQEKEKREIARAKRGM